VKSRGDASVYQNASGISGPMAGNPLLTRSDLQRAVDALCRPVLAKLSDGRAAVDFAVIGGHFSIAEAALEGVTRPLWGLVPLAAGGGFYDSWHVIQAGLVNGIDPSHPGYWGRAADFSHAFVEMAPIGVGLALAPDPVWHSLPPSARAGLAEWLGQINQFKLYPNNWQLFRVLVNMGLQEVGAGGSAGAIAASFDVIDSLYAGDGWYRDGTDAPCDYYNSFAFHYYSLI
jgi:hypothetical protein